MSRSTVRAWFLLHKWTGLACTLFLLMLCLTRLPLIFHHEIDALTERGARVATGRMDAPKVSLDRIIAAELAARPGYVGLFVSFDEDRPVVNVTTGPRPDATGPQMRFQSYDLTSGRAIGSFVEPGGVMEFLRQLHTDLFLGLPGMLFLGSMGALFVAAIVSGVVLYAPFMRKLDFGTVRASRSPRLRWLDLHNLLGIVTVAWASVVGLTGVINTLSTPILQQWRTTELAQMTAGYRSEAPAAGRLASLQRAVDRAVAAAPGMRPQFVAFPGGAFSSRRHYAVFLQGATPLTRRLLTPALIDAESGQLTAIRPMPPYAQALLLSQPLHFGDYGGLPLKLLWATLDLVTVVVLGSGVYLWLGRRRTPVDAHVREVESGGIAVAPSP